MDAGNHQHKIPSLRKTTKVSGTRLNTKPRSGQYVSLHLRKTYHPGVESAMRFPASPWSSVPCPCPPAFPCSHVLASNVPESQVRKALVREALVQKSHSPEIKVSRDLWVLTRESKWVQRFHSMPRIALCSSAGVLVLVLTETTKSETSNFLNFAGKQNGEKR